MWTDINQIERSVLSNLDLQCSQKASCVGNCEERLEKEIFTSCI